LELRDIENQFELDRGFAHDRYERGARRCLLAIK